MNSIFFYYFYRDLCKSKNKVPKLENKVPELETSFDKYLTIFGF